MKKEIINGVEIEILEHMKEIKGAADEVGCLPLFRRYYNKKQMFNALEKPWWDGYLHAPLKGGLIMESADGDYDADFYYLADVDLTDNNLTWRDYIVVEDDNGRLWVVVLHCD